jgi:hypothetical protein
MAGQGASASSCSLRVLPLAVWSRLGAQGSSRHQQHRRRQEAEEQEDEEEAYEEQTYNQGGRRVQRRGEQRQPVWDRLGKRQGPQYDSTGAYTDSAYQQSWGGGGRSRGGGGGGGRRSQWNEHDDRFEEVPQLEEEEGYTARGGRYGSR